MPDVIIRLESLESDLEQYLGNRREFPHLVEGPGGDQSAALVVKYFSQLSKKQVLSLFEVYQVDHELFGYSPATFLSWATEDL